MLKFGIVVPIAVCFYFLLTG